MLQKYDTIKSSLLLAFAAAGGVAMSGGASAENVTCNLENGFATGLANYVLEAQECVSSADNFEMSIADGLLSQVNAERAANGLTPLNRRASLDMAAQAHALDMSVRIFADHTDPEGRDHLHRIRAFDRTMLVGASGANVTVSPAAADASGIHQKIQRDSFSQDNILRASFTDIGIGVVEEAGQYYVVQVFAAAEGDLYEAIPVSAKRSQSLKARLADRDRQVVAWGLTDSASGEMLAKSSLPRLRSSSLGNSDSAALDILVAVRQDTYVLKGPLISGR